MADQPYDPNSDDKYAPRHLNEAEESAANSEAATDSSAPANSDELSGAESKGGAEGSFYTDGHRAEDSSEDADDDTDDTVGEGYTGGGEGKKKGIRATISGLSRGRKALLIGAATGGGGVIALIILLFILASSLKIPNLMQNITTYEFARLTRQYANSADRLTTEKLAADALDDGSWKTLVQDKYQNLRNSTWGKFDKYRPDQVMKNLQSEHNFQLDYRTTAFGRSQLAGVTLADETHLVIQQSARTKFVPGLSALIDFKNNVSLAQRVQPGLKAALDAGIRGQDIGPIIRGAVAKDIRQQLGISLVAWNLGKFKGKNAAEARTVETQERTKVVDKAVLEGEDNTTTDKLKQGVSEGKTAETAALASDAAVNDAIKAGGVIQSVRDAIGSALRATGLDTFASFINPVYGVALPICIVYDGSLDRSGPTINQQTTQQAATYYHYASAADELKAGSQSTDPSQATELGLAAGATSASLGDTNNSNAIVRANGGTVDTHNTVSAETSAGGEFTLLDATPGISSFAGPINSVADTLCPALTNLNLALGIGAINILIGVASGGTSIGTEEAAGEAATVLIEEEAGNIAGNILTRAIGSVTSRATKLLDISKDTAKSAGKVALLTIAAKIVVNARAGQMHSGVSQDTDAANEADAGGNGVAQMQEQQQLYGRPMTPAEVSQSDSADVKTVANINRSKSLYERYLATDNAQSLLNRVAMSVSGNLNSSMFRTLANFASLLFRPMTYFGSVATSFSGTAHAATDNYHYGNVQFGWSDAEENLINSDGTYKSSLENQKILDDSGNADAIATEYGDCFKKPIGDLLSNGDIVRDHEGNVIDSDSAKCSPKFLGPDNSKYGDHMVFRWRLANSYGNTLDQLTDGQNVSS